uniref:WD repeat and FYVE domain-containing protein 3 n=1 Tax=Timema tahoe TaxID=61484 RepID=A0A7R9FIN8_9NEOP|nr:unnamed protein product [Timema tahoe]
MNEAAFNNCNAEDYINIDNYVQTEPDTIDIDALVENFKESWKGKEEEKEEEANDIVLEEEKYSVKTYQDAVKSLKELQQFALQRNDSDMLSVISEATVFVESQAAKESKRFCEEVVQVLGLDWVLLFLQGHLHPSTVVWGLRVLVVLCSCPPLLHKFREGFSNGGWLSNSELVLHNKIGVVLSYQLETSPPKPNISSHELKSEALHVPGFQQLGWLLPQHIDVPEVYFLLMALMMGQPVKLLPADSKLDLDNVWNFMFGVPASQSVTCLSGRVSLCPEAVMVLLSMVRTMLNQEGKSPESLPEWLRDYPVTIIQFLFFLYHNMVDFMPVFMGGDVLGALAGTLFPRQAGSEGGSHSSTPGEEVKMYPTGEPPIMIRSPSRELSNHPARKFVMDFLRVIVVDSLSLPVSGKGPPTIDLVLEASPEHASVMQQTKFQTEVLGTLMEHLLAADVLIGEQAALPVVPGGGLQYIAPNVCYLAARIVDKLWQGTFAKDPHEVFDFLVKLISQAKRRPSSFSLEGLYHCLNRTILFLLSRRTESIADQMVVLEALHKLTNHSQPRLSKTAPEGVREEWGKWGGTCVTSQERETEKHLNTNITSIRGRPREIHSAEKSMKDSRYHAKLDTGMRTMWHVHPNAEDDDLTSQQGHNLMAVAAERVWEELYVCKKPAIEEVFKITLSSPHSKAPDLVVVRDQVHETAYRLWLNYIDMERKSFCRVPWELHNQIQSKIQKVTGGLTRLASRTKVKKEETIRVRYSSLSHYEVADWTLNHVALVKELVEVRTKQHQQNQAHMQRYVFEEWLQTETELTRERGLWGPVTPCRLDKWMLDMTEGPSRMRKKMMKNELFYLHYPYRPELDYGDNRALKYKVASSYDSKEYYQKYRPQSLFERERDLVLEAQLPVEEIVPEVPPSDSNGDDLREIGFHGVLERHAVHRSISEPEDALDDTDTDTTVGEEPDTASDNQTLIRLLEEQEKISHMFRCARIQGLDTTEGLLLFGKEHFYVIDGFTLLKSREIRDIESLPENIHEPILPSPGSPRRSRAMRQCSKFSYEDIREVHKRRYLLQPMALEVFSGDGRNYLLAFPRKVRNKIYQRFMAFATAISDNAQQSVAGQKRTANVEQGAGLLSNLIGETSVTQRWVRGEISNFQYLIHLNTLAGRSYNDLMQYPVFPWVLADYDSEELDLTDPATFRDFSRPMGAQSVDRLHQFNKRYKEWDDPHGETPPYHYGTHYSSAMIVCSYLVRMEPFVQHFLRLQLVFNNLHTPNPQHWSPDQTLFQAYGFAPDQSPASDQASTGGGHFDLADRMFNSVREAWLSASKHNMADVKELIPEFFYLPEFLVNSNNFELGCKQNGVQLGDIVLPPWAKGDPREFIRVHRMALECDYVSQHIHEWIDLIFGYKQYGPPAVDATNVFHHLFYEGNVDIYNIDDPLKKNATIGFINNFGQIPKQLFKKPHPAKKISQRSSVVDPGPITPGLSFTTGDRLFFHNLDNLKPSLQPIKELKGPVGQIMQSDKSVLAVEQNKVLVPPTFNKYVAWGFADHSLRIGLYDSDKAVLVCEAIMQSNGEIVTCVCPSVKLIITAGTSSVVTIWEYVRKQLNIKQSLYGHTDAVTCLACSPAYNVVVSGSRDATAIVWDLSRRIFVRQFRGHTAPIAAVAINELTGDIATCAGTWLHLWSINGEELASVNTCVGRADRMQQILCVAFSQIQEWDSQNVVMTGSTDGVVRMWSVDYVQVPKEDRQAVKEGEDTKENGVKNLVKQISISADFPGNDTASLVKSGSESSLSEDEGETTPEVESTQEEKREGKKEIERAQEEKEMCSDEDTNQAEEAGESGPIPHAPHTPLPRQEAVTESPVVLRRKASRANPHFRKSECGRSRAESEGGPAVDLGEVTCTLVSTANTGGEGIRTSKSDTSLTDSFVIVGDTDVVDVNSRGKEEVCKRRRNPQNSLREGFKWQRQLVFRSKLTMHTAYDRKDNAEPASITSLAVSRGELEGGRKNVDKLKLVVDLRGRKREYLFWVAEGVEVLPGEGKEGNVAVVYGGVRSKAVQERSRVSLGQLRIGDHNELVAMRQVHLGVRYRSELVGRRLEQHGIGYHCELAGRRLEQHGIGYHCELVGRRLEQHGIGYHCELVGRRLGQHGIGYHCELVGRRDHRTVYVGDARGRVFSWSVSDQPGRGVADHWLKDEGADACVACGVRFNLYERRHHCRNCGQVFCSKCSRFESEISRLRILKPVRVCQGCYAALRFQHYGDGGT